MKEEGLNALGHMAAEAKKKGALTVPWYEIINVYFRGANSKQAVEKWAEENGLHASFDYKEQGLKSEVIHSVTFFAKDRK